MAHKQQTQRFKPADFLTPVMFVQGRPVVNQNSSVITKDDLHMLADVYFPAFLRYWIALENTTGYQWRVTSLVRDSVSHQVGQAVDFAPDISDASHNLYAVSRQSDPVLYKREPLLRHLQRLVPVNFSGNGPVVSLGTYVEPDHLHVQVLRNTPNGRFENKLIKWGITKPLYGDTYERAKLPLIGEKGLALPGGR